MKDINKLDEKKLENVAGGVISGIITQEEALAKALEHLHLTKDQIDFVEKCELDFERGREIYEIELRKGFREFEFEIDATTGAVLKFKQD